MNINNGDRVQVSFISNSSTAYSGNHFFGTGTVDLAEDGYIFGRLDDGKTFMCQESDCRLIKADFICLGKTTEGLCNVFPKGTVLKPCMKTLMHCFCGRDSA